MRDVRDALRSLRAAPGSTVVALIVFAFGIGASTLIFSMVDAVVLRALPFDEPDRIVSVGSLYNGHPGLDTAATFLEWRERQTAFEALTAIDDGALIVNADTQAEEVRLERVTAEFFSVLRVRPRIGEPFTADNEVDGRDRVAIISDSLCAAASAPTRTSSEDISPYRDPCMPPAPRSASIEEMPRLDPLPSGLSPAR